MNSTFAARHRARTAAACSWRAGRGGGHEDHRLGVGHEDGAGRLLREAPGLEGQRLAAELEGLLNDSYNFV